MTQLYNVTKRLLVGRPLRSGQLGETLLPKWLALPVFCSDPISSVAYATEQILFALAAGGAAYLSFAKPVAAFVAVLLVVVVASYRQTCFAYPNGGGAFAVSLDNLGQRAALTAAAALLVDYVMTVAVSVVGGVVAITSAVPSLSPNAVPLSVGFVVLLAVVNLRGVQESGKAFALPTYLFIATTFLLFGTAVWRALDGGIPDAQSATEQLTRTAHVGGAFTLLLAMRAFASGCTALTGVEAISNGVPSFRKPNSRNAAMTLVIMGVLAIAMFGGITVLSLEIHARAYPDGDPSVISQIAATVWGGNSFLFYLFQAATAGILVLAANTAFNGFPVLASILAQNRFLPRQLHTRGDRLVFSNGIVLLAGVAAALIVGFDANIERLIQLYILGVFTSFTLSQFGMVKHWQRELDTSTPTGSRRRIRRAQAINGIGALVTGIVLLIVLYTKFLRGAWLAIAGMLALYVLMSAIRRHYDQVSVELSVSPDVKRVLPARNHGIVVVSRVHLPTLRAVAYARATRPSTLRAVTVAFDDGETQALQREWDRFGIEVPLTVLDSPYREITRPLIEYIRTVRGEHPRDVVTVFVPEYVVGKWWEQLLHNQSALRLKGRLLFESGVMVTSVPWQLRSSQHGDDLVAVTGDEARA